MVAAVGPCAAACKPGTALPQPRADLPALRRGGRVGVRRRSRRAPAERDARLSFMFATGIENSIPTIDNGRTRIDQMEKCGHYRHGGRISSS